MTRKDAVAAALKTCNTRFTFFRANCAAFAHSDANWVIAMGDPVIKANSSSLKQSKGGSKSCNIIAAFCANGKNAPDKN